METQFSSVQLSSRVRLFATPWPAACQASLSIPNSRGSPRLVPIESVVPSSHLILVESFKDPPSTSGCAGVLDECGRVGGITLCQARSVPWFLASSLGKAGELMPSLGEMEASEGAQWPLACPGAARSLGDSEGQP